MSVAMPRRVQPAECCGSVLCICNPTLTYDRLVIFTKDRTCNLNGGFMMKKIVARFLRPAILVAVFGLGYVCGTVNQQPADAQIGGLMEKGGGMLGSAKELGSSIIEMQDH